MAGVDAVIVTHDHPDHFDKIAGGLAGNFSDVDVIGSK